MTSAMFSVLLFIIYKESNYVEVKWSSEESLTGLGGGQMGEVWLITVYIA